jgi:hypothetical protein
MVSNLEFGNQIQISEVDIKLLRGSYYIVEIVPFQIKLSSIHCCEIQIIYNLSCQIKATGKVVSTSVQTAFGTTQLGVVGSLCWVVDCRFSQVSMPFVSLGCVHLEESTTYCQKIGKLGEFCTNKKLKRG